MRKKPAIIWKGVMPWDVLPEEFVSSEESTEEGVSHPLGTYAISFNGEIWQLQEVRLDILRAKHPTVPHRYRDPEDVNTQPIAVEVKDGEYFIADGHHRVENAKRRGEKRIMAWVTVVDSNFRRVQLHAQ